MPVTKYVGRFAPSPTGPLHFGSIITALGSFLDAHSQKGIWLLRIDDIDTARVRTGACDAIMRALEALGLHWDGDVVFQGQRLAAYQTALAELRSRNMLYACVCPRRILKGKPYPGTCRDLTAPPGKGIRTGSRPTTNQSVCMIDYKDNSHCLYKRNGEILLCTGQTV